MSWESGDNPCNICKYRDGSCPSECVLDTTYRKDYCLNYACFLQGDGAGCLLGLDEICGASTAFVSEEEDDEEEFEDEEEEATE